MIARSTHSSNLLERHSHNAFQKLNAEQLHFDVTAQSFTSQVTEPSMLAGLMLGGLVGRGLGCLSRPVLGKAGSIAISLTGESLVFTGTGRWMRGQGLEGFGHDFLHSLISLGSLRLAGFAGEGHNQIFQRFLNSSAMVAGNQVAAAMNIIDRPQGNLANQFFQAFILDIQSGFSRGLLELAVPRLSHWEKMKDLSMRVQGKELGSLLPVQQNIFISKPESRWQRIVSRMMAGTALLVHANEAAAQAYLPRSVTHSDFISTALHGLATTGFTLSGIVVGVVPGLLYPVLKGKYKLYALLPIVAGGTLLATRLGSDFSSLREAAGNIAFLGSAFATGLIHEVWLHRRIHDRERIHFWQHDKTRGEYLKTQVVERTTEDYQKIMEAPPIAIVPDDHSWSHTSISRNEDGSIRRDIDGYPETFVRFVHDAPRKSAQFLNGNYLYNRIFNGLRVTAFMEGVVSSLPLTWLYQKWNKVPGRTLRDFLVQKFDISYPERFDWSALDKPTGSFNDFFTRPLVTPPEGLEVKPGQTFHDGVLDVVARGNLLDQGIRLAGKGPIANRLVTEAEGRQRVVDVMTDAVLPLRKILGRAAAKFEGESQTLIATYLSPRHWHQTLSPVSGKIIDIEVIEGFRHTVDPGVRQVKKDVNFGGSPGSYFQSENSRVVVTIDTPEYGPVVIVCTAAALVSTSRVFLRIGEQVRLGELLHEYRWGSHNTLVMKSSKVALTPGLIPGQQVYVRGTKPEGADGIEELFVPRSALR